MKKVLLPLVLFALIVGVFTSCADKTPTGTVKSYIESVKAEKFDKAIEYFYFEKEVDKTELDALAAKMKEGYSENGVITKYEIVSEAIDEGTPETATVVTKIYYGEESEPDEEVYKLLKNDKGEWKIDISSK